MKELREAKSEQNLRKVSHSVHLLTQEQARQLLTAAKSDPLEALYMLALTTGMRWGDLLMLKWEDIDLTRGKLQVSETIPQKGQGRLQISEQKTKIWRRIVLTTLAVAALTRHRLHQDEQRLTARSVWQDHDLVFCNTVGNPLDVSHVRRHSFVPLRERASLPFLHFHDLRPSVVRLLLLAGAHPKVVQELFGYRSSAMTVEVNISSSMLLSLQEEAIQQLSTLLVDEQKS